MDDSSQQLLRELAEWQPPRGVISVYLHIDPADRGGGWRIELEHGLKKLVDEAESGEDRSAVAAAVERALARFPGDAPHPSGRVQVGFVEVAEKGRDVWHGFQSGLVRSVITREPAPHLGPLVRILERGAPVGVVLLAAEQAQAFEWARGSLAEVGDWELEVASYDWRERKSPQRNPQRDGTGTTAAGRDQHQQRLDASRARFLKELGNLLSGRFGERGWRRIVIFGEGDMPALLRAGLEPHQAKLVHEVNRDLIRADRAQLSEQIDAEVVAINLQEERDLLERLEEAIGTEAGAALGPQEVLGALEQGRASHLLFDPQDEFEGRDGRPGTEVMIALGLMTGAAITPVEDEQLAARLAERDGAAALLRY